MDSLGYLADDIEGIGGANISSAASNKNRAGSRVLMADKLGKGVNGEN